MKPDRLTARRDRVLELADLGEILQNYGYAVIPDRQREQQFSCDLHGPDNKPSARYYGATNSTYCWVCQKSRNALNWVMEKENLGFREAVTYLERQLNLPVLEWDGEYVAPLSPVQEIEQISNRQTTYKDTRTRIRKFLDGLTCERFDNEEESLSCNSILSFWEVYDRIDYGVAREKWSEQKGIESLLKLQSVVMKKLEKC